MPKKKAAFYLWNRKKQQIWKAENLTRNKVTK